MITQAFSTIKFTSFQTYSYDELCISDNFTVLKQVSINLRLKSTGSSQENAPLCYMAVVNSSFNSAFV